MGRTYKHGDFQAVHENPIWRDQANFIIAAYLGEKDGRNEWEQIWAKDLGTRRFLICCIPFFAYDLSLGDEVETDEHYVVQRVVTDSGRYTFRVWFGNSVNPSMTSKIKEEIKEFKSDLEWSSPNLLAISVPNLDVAQALAMYLQSQQDAGYLIYETGRSSRTE